MGLSKILSFVVDVWYPMKFIGCLCVALLTREQHDYSLTAVNNIWVKADFKVKVKMDLFYSSEKLAKAVVFKDCDAEE